MDTDIANKSNLSRSRMGKFLRNPKKNITHWHDAISYYKASKLTRELINRIGLQKLSEISGYSTSCISTIEKMNISGHYLFAMQRVKEQIKTKEVS